MAFHLHTHNFSIERFKKGLKQFTQDAIKFFHFSIERFKKGLKRLPLKAFNLLNFSIERFKKGLKHIRLGCKVCAVPTFTPSKSLSS